MQTNINQKGFAPFLIIIGVLAVIAVAIFFARGYFKSENSSPSPSPSASYRSLSEDPKYTEVKDKYNLSEEQLQILSTVDPNDNE